MILNNETMAELATMTKPKKLHELIQDALDGRPVTWLHMKIEKKIDYTELTRKVKGDVIIRENELSLINTALNTSFVLPD